MNAAVTEPFTPEVFSVVVLYEDRPTRDRAVGVCRHMAAQVGDEIEFNFSWWKFDFLQDADLAQQAAEAAMNADMLVVSANPGRGLALSFTEWVEVWLPRRGDRESILVVLIGSEQDTVADAATEYLRGIANRARMDYLAKPLLALSAGTNKPAASVSNRAQAKAPVLGDLLRRPHPPSHWGINE